MLVPFIIILQIWAGRQYSNLVKHLGPTFDTEFLHLVWFRIISLHWLLGVHRELIIGYNAILLRLVPKLWIITAFTFSHLDHEFVVNQAGYCQIIEVQIQRGRAIRVSLLLYFGAKAWTGLATLLVGGNHLLHILDLLPIILNFLSLWIDYTLLSFYCSVLVFYLFLEFSLLVVGFLLSLNQFMVETRH